MRAWLALLAVAASTAFAAPPPDWLDSPPAREFRERVVQLALLYGESGGVDLEGFQLEARQLRPLEAGCGEVEVVTRRDYAEVRRDVVRACKAR